MIRDEGTYIGKIFVNCIHPGVVKTAQQDGVVEAYQKKIIANVGDNVIGQAASSALAGANYVMRAVAEKDSPEGYAASSLPIY